MLLSIVIVSWNTRDLLACCLRSLYDFPLSDKFEIWVVDNNSSDHSVDMVKDQFPQVKIIENKENQGFAHGNNQAMRRSTGKYVMLLNPDTEVKPGSLDVLVNFLEGESQAAAAGAKLVSPDGGLQSSCHPELTLPREMWRLFHLDTLHRYGTYNMHKWDPKSPRQVDVLQGAALVLRSEALEQVGLLDEDYFMYTEEVDLCFRLRKAGWRLYWIPEAEVLHYGGQSTKLVAEKMFLALYESRLKFFRKHYGATAARGYKLVLTAAALARLGFSPISRLVNPSQRDRHKILASHYTRLIAALPRM
jgi:GT2 family glycosyltransferase